MSNNRVKNISMLFVDSLIFSVFICAFEYFIYFILAGDIISINILWKNIINYIVFFSLVSFIISLPLNLTNKRSFFGSFLLFFPGVFVSSLAYFLSQYHKNILSLNTIFSFFVIVIFLSFLLGFLRYRKRKFLIFFEALFAISIFSFLIIQRIVWTKNLPEAKDGRSIIVVLVDALRADMLNGKIMPATYSLARRSVLFTNAHSAASATIPSVFALFTGKLPYFFIEKGGVRKVLSREGTIAETLKKRGYTTLGVSANLLVSKSLGFSKGFDAFLNVGLEWRRFSLYKFSYNSMFPTIGIKAFNYLSLLPFKLSDSADFINIEAKKLLKKYKGKKIFLYLHYMDPHSPYGPPEFLLDEKKPFWYYLTPQWQIKEKNGFPELFYFKYPEEIETAMKTLYMGEARYFDSEFRKLLLWLQKREFLQNNTLIFLADHGEEFREHGGLSHGNTLYEELLRVPLFIHTPGVSHFVIEKPVSSNFIVYNFLKTGTLSTGENPFIFSTVWTSRRGSFKEVYSVIEFPLKTIGTWRLYRGRKRWEFETYNLASDPEEKLKLLSPESHKKQIMGLFKYLNGKTPKISGISSSYMNKLKSLGYVK